MLKFLVEECEVKEANSSIKFYAKIQTELVSMGHIEVLKYFIEKYEFTPVNAQLFALSILKQAIEWGHLKIVKYVEKRFKLTLQS